MMDVLVNILKADWFWRPEGISFDNRMETGNERYPKYQDLIWMPMFGLLFLILRIGYEHVIGNRLAQFSGVPMKKHNYKRNGYLESVYKDQKRPSDDEMKAIAKKLSWRQVEVVNWFIRRRNSERPDLATKFCESSWRFLFYTGAFTFGMSILLRAPWFYDTLECWLDNYPYQTMWTSVYYYYMIEGGFYFSLLLTLMKDVKRKDFLEQIVHHFTTLLLIIGSYLVNYVRIGSLVMAVHDISDVILELGKSVHYGADRYGIQDHLFTLFAITFIISRLFVYPYIVLYAAFVKHSWIFGVHPQMVIFNVLLWILQVLHIFWSYTILKMARKMVQVGTVEKDDRSDVDEESIDEGEEMT